MPTPRSAKHGSHFSQWIILVAALSVLIGATALNLYVAHVRTAASEEARLRTQALAIKENVLANLASVNDVLVGVRAEILHRKADANLEGRFRMLADAMPGVRTLTVMDAQGTVLASSRPELLGKNFAYRDYFLTPRNNPDPGKLFVSPPFKTALGIYGISLTKAVVEPDGSFGGIVAATLDPLYFKTLLDSMLYAPDMWTAIAHGDGLQFMMVPDREGQAGKDLAQPGSFFSRHRDSGNEVDVLTGQVYATAEERIMAVQSIQSTTIGQDKPIVVAVGRDLNAIYATWRSDVEVQVALVSLITIGSTFGLYRFRRRQQEFARKESDSANALAAHERFLAALSDNVPGIVAYWDRQLRCRYASRGYLEWFGHGPDRIVGAELAQVIGTDMLAEYRPFIDDALRGQPQLFERQIRKPGGETGHAIVHYIPDRVGDSVIGFFVLLTDITKQKRDQDERLAAMIEQRDALVREIHHRIKNTLQAVAGMLRRQLGKYHELREPLENAVAQVFSIACVHGLQGQSDGETLRLGDMLGGIVRESQSSLEPYCMLDYADDSNARFRIDKAEAVPLALILNELLRNAVKHSRRQAGDKFKSIEVRLRGQQEAATIVITNNGASFPPGFDFAAGTGLGTGLGLVRSLMPMHGAALTFRYLAGKVSAELHLEPPVVSPEAQGQ